MAGNNPKTTVELRANAKVPAGPIQITFGGVKNPRSFKPTGLFEIRTFDAAKPPNVVATGEIDNIAMTKPGAFSVLAVKPTNQTNGMLASYDVSWIA
jgi:hypothetical protein